jgi:8-oxo-dGTP pyrophosphatase MutT (NUDIX family)
MVPFDGEKFLLLHRVLNWSGWEYPKGGIEEGEDIEKAIGRELFEETGISKFEIVGKIDSYIFLDKLHNREVFMQNYLIRISSNNRVHFENQAEKDGVKVLEHDDFKWCFPKEAVKLLTHNNSKRSMKRAIKMLGLEMEK